MEPHLNIEPSLVDMLLSRHDSRYYLSHLNQNMNVFSKHVLEYLKKNNVLLGTQFGQTGASVLHALAEPSTIYEITDSALVGLPPRQSKALIENCILLVTEYTEGGCFLNSNFIQWLKESNITPRKLFLHTSNYNLKSIDIENVILLPCANMFLLYTLQVEPKLVTDSNYKSDYIDFIKTARSKKRFEYLAMIYNRKPRFPRVLMLSKLHERGVLDDCLWTLAWNNNLPLDLSWNGSKNVFRFQEALEKSDIPIIQKFLKDWQNDLPRVLQNSLKNNNISDTNYFDKNWASTVSCGVAIETLTVRDNSNFSYPMGFMTEKTCRYLLLGMPFFVVAAEGAYPELQRIGFHVDHCDLDELSNVEKINRISDLISTDHNNNDYAENAMLYLDIPWLIDKVFSGLLSIEHSL